MLGLINLKIYKYGRIFNFPEATFFKMKFKVHSIFKIDHK